MSTEEDSLLTDLCTICHIHPPKYRCPRCNTRTCSLPCSKRHKLWSQCSGVRDPAAYLRRADLATPSAFDRDFNFLTGIERGLERAERDVDRRDLAAPAVPSGVDPAVVGLDGGEDAGGDAKRRRVGDHAFSSSGGGGKVPLAKGEAAFLNNAKNAGVCVVRAPRGLTRRRENASKWNTRHKCLNWVVEWLAPYHPAEAERRKLRHVMEGTALADAYNQAYPLSKEERDARAPTDDSPSGRNRQTEGPEQGVSLEQVEPEASGETPPSGSAAAATASATSTDTATATATAPTTSASAPTPTTTAPPPATAPTPSTTHRPIHLYLHRPRTPTKHPVLIPLPTASTLAASLKERTVLEFPTIYALPYSPERLGLPFSGENSNSDSESLPFILEEVFLRENPGFMLGFSQGDDAVPGGEGETRTQTRTQTEGGSGSGSGSGTGEADAEVEVDVDLGKIDEGTVVEMLRKDLLVPDDS